MLGIWEWGFPYHRDRVAVVMIPWVPEDISFLSILVVRGEAASTRCEPPREKNNLWPWSQEWRVSSPCNFRITYYISHQTGLEVMCRGNPNAVAANRKKLDVFKLY